MLTVKSGGAEIPAIGFGTYRMTGPEVRNIVPHAWKAGFRHFDTAQFYNNESDLGEALLEARVERPDVFITTKVWISNYKPRKFTASVEESLRKLKTDYVDLLLLHWPNNDVALDEQVAGLEAAQRKGLAMHIGVSNFNIELLRKVERIAKSPIVTNQVEFHPYIDQSKLIRGMRAQGVALTSYYGMADGLVPNDPILAAIGKRHGKSAAQVVLRWVIQQGFIALSKTVNPNRVAENIDIFDFKLTDDDLSDIHKLSSANKRLVDPAGLAPRWDD